MSGTTKQWLVVLVFFLGFFVFTFAEALWVNRKTAAGFGRSLLFSFTSNIFAITVGYFVSFVIFAVMFAMVWDESINQVPARDVVMWIAVVIAMLFPVGLLALVKRLALKLVTINGLSMPWVYCFAAAILFNITVTLGPVLFTYFS